jgi:TetR/AcrR family transcriptional regulator, transcriptional repressor for nem operon
MKKGEATRQRILEEAAVLFNRLGYEGASVQQVMLATGLERGSIYRYFESKEDLAVSAFEYAVTNSVKFRTSDTEHIPNNLEKLRFCVSRFVATPSTMPGGCPLINSAVDADEGNPALRKVVRSAFADWKKRLSAFVTAGIAAGEILPDTKPAMIIDVIIGCLEGVFILSRVQGDRAPLKHAETMLNRMLDSIAAQKA